MYDTVAYLNVLFQHRPFRLIQTGLLQDNLLGNTDFTYVMKFCRYQKVGQVFRREIESPGKFNREILQPGQMLLGFMPLLI
ncbi:hypothetical protein SDC9_165949 [bioreactor metagenome]|uniref:Uncharacterized protein n=1 Tax=bioreactor metagenome TaxID=1076179 RepID=A0A645FY87_9ZZZZ